MPQEKSNNDRKEGNKNADLIVLESENINPQQSNEHA